MVPVSSFMSRLLPNVVGCPEPLAQQALVDAAIEFCDRTLAVTADLDAVTLVEGVSSYEFDLPSQTQLAHVMRVWVGDSLLTPVPTFVVGRTAADPGRPTHYYTQNPDEVLNLTLFPAPDAESAVKMRVRVALRPTRSAATLPSVLFNDWLDAVVEAAQARIYAIPDQVFTNESKALLMSQRAQARTNTARVEATRGRVVAPLSVQLRSF